MRNAGVLRHRPVAPACESVLCSSLAIGGDDERKRGRGGKSLEAKLALAQSFVELAEVTSVEDIAVNMVVERLGRHRKTFYYHFPSKGHLIVWLFRYELAQELERTFAPEQLIYGAADDSFPELPFYARNIDEGQRIYNAPFFDALYGCFERRRNYYRNVFSQLGPGSLEHYLLNLYLPVITDDIHYLIERRVSEQKLILQKGIRAQLEQGYSVDFRSESLRARSFHATFSALTARRWAAPPRRSRLSRT